MLLQVCRNQGRVLFPLYSDDPYAVAADEAKRKHVDLKAKAAALQQLCSGASSGGATRDRSRSPRHSHELPTSIAA